MFNVNKLNVKYFVTTFNEMKNIFVVLIYTEITESTDY